MAKYILKQEAIFALTNEANTHNNPVKRAYTRAAAIIEQITAEDVQPVKHGHWKAYGSLPTNQWSCSECRGLVEVSHYCNECYYDFCPNCGAKMDGGDTYD